jgi:hypothetical protein
MWGGEEVAARFKARCVEEAKGVRDRLGGEGVCLKVWWVEEVRGRGAAGRLRR